MIDFGSWGLISPEAKLALLIARALVDEKEADSIGDYICAQPLDWQRARDIITCHELSPSSYVFLKKYSAFMPPGESEILERHFHSNLLRLSLMQRELIRVLRSLQEGNITALPLKGAHFLLDAGLYGDKAYLRPMLDIDILLKKESYPQAQNILEAQGYKKELKGNREEYWLNKNCNMAFIKMFQDYCSYMVELHWALDYPRGVRLLPHLWDRIKRIETEGNNFYLFSPEDAFFSLILHQRRFGNALSLKRACDAAILLTKRSGDLDWDYIIREARRAKMLTILYFAITQTVALFDIKIPSSVLKTSEVSHYKKRLLENLIMRYTFSCGLNLNRVYLKSHFLLYDNFMEPLKSILDIPQEQFAKFYNLKPYTAKTSSLYRWRYLSYLKTLLLNKY